MLGLKVFLIIATSIAAVSAASRRMVETELLKDSYEDFMKCLGNSTHGYVYSVSEDGEMMIFPSDKRQADESLDDAVMSQCIREFSERIMLSLISNDGIMYDEYQGHRLSDSTYESVASDGVKGIRIEESMSKRTIDVIQAVLWNEKNPLNGRNDLNLVKEYCYKRTAPFRAKQYINNDSGSSMTVYDWPHHRCTVNRDRNWESDRRMVYIAPNTEGPTTTNAREGKVNALLGYYILDQADGTMRPNQLRGKINL